MAAHHYYYADAASDHTHAYILPTVRRALARRPPPARLLDLGCGNGSSTAIIAALGYDVVGLDNSPMGIAEARKAFPGPRFEVADVYDDLAATYGLFDIILSLEVVEHLMSPKTYAERLADCLKPGGLAIVSTPYHGYVKNLALAVAGKIDAHHDALWEGGHVKFFSRAKLVELFARVGLELQGFDRVGRIPPLAKSMVATFVKPA
ncbi:MAG: class I SAM-dependent methyltransferase [Phenylobacterium sp.]